MTFMQLTLSHQCTNSLKAGISFGASASIKYAAAFGSDRC